MKNRLARQVRRVGVTDPIAAARRYDYADAFEVRLPEPDPYPPETWVRAGLEATPGVVQWLVDLPDIVRSPEAFGGIPSGFRIGGAASEVGHFVESTPLMQ